MRGVVSGASTSTSTGPASRGTCAVPGRAARPPGARRPSGVDGIRVSSITTNTRVSIIPTVRGYARTSGSYLITPVPGEHESRDITSTTAPVHRALYAIRRDRGRSTPLDRVCASGPRGGPGREGDIWRNIIRHYTIV